MACHSVGYARRALDVSHVAGNDIDRLNVCEKVNVKSINESMKIQIQITKHYVAMHRARQLSCKLEFEVAVAQA